MKLRGHDFGNVFNSSGARGFVGEGYWFHGLWRNFGLDYTGSTFVAKTTTLAPRIGNMPMRADGITPKNKIPKCIVVKPVKGVVLNAVGLSGPGARRLIDDWMTLKVDRLVVSFMSVAPTSMQRVHEVGEFVKLFEPLVLVRGQARLALQINFSCPNVGIDMSKFKELGEEMKHVLNIAEMLNIPIMVKVNALFPLEIIKGVAEEHAACDAIVCSNTIPWGKMPEKINWKKLFGSDVSPLSGIEPNGGGLSGEPLLPIVADWIRRARRNCVAKPIVGGGGILSASDADVMLDAGADAVELGAISILRPWRVGGIIRHVNRRFGAASA